MSLDFFGFDETCGIPACSIIVLIIVILFGFLVLLIILFLIRHRIRSNRRKIHQKAKRNQNLEEEISDPAKASRKKQKKRFKPKIIEKDKKILKVNVPPNTTSGQKLENETFSIKNSQFLRQHFEEKTKEKEKNGEVLGKGSIYCVDKNFLLNKNLYLTRLEHKKHMYPDDPSVQFENVSNFSFEESKNNSVPNFFNSNKRAVSKDGLKEGIKEEGFIKIVLFERENSKTKQKNTKNMKENPNKINKNFEKKDIGTIQLED